MSATPIESSLKAAETAIAEGCYKDALQHCKAALKADKKSSNALILIGKAAYFLKEYDQSELAYRRALESTSHDSDLVPMWQGLADVFAAKNNPKSEVEANEHLLQLTKEEDPNNRTARIRLAQAYNSLGDSDHAIQQYKHLLQKEQPGTPERLALLRSSADILLQRDEKLAAQEMQAKLQSPSSSSSTADRHPPTPPSPPSPLTSITGTSEQSLPTARRTISCIELDVLAAQAAAQIEARDADHDDDLSTAAVLHEIANTAPSALIYLPYREEHLRRCLLRIFHAPRRSTERQAFRLEALKECVATICRGGPCTSLAYEAAVWLLEEEEEIKGGQVSVGGQEVGGFQTLAGGVQVGAEGHIGAGRDATVAYAAENFSRRMYHQFPTNPTARVLLTLMLRRHAVHEKRPITQAERRRLESLLSSAMAEGSHVDCASGFKALAELQYDNRHYEAANTTVLRGMRWLQHRRDRGHESLTQIALSLRLILAKSLRRLGKLDEAEHHFAALAGWVSEGEAAFAELCGSTPTSIHQQALRGVALVALARGDTAAARAQYERILGKAALGRGPAEHWAHSDYGWLMYQQGEYQCAREHLEQAIQVAEEEGCSVTDSQLAEHHYRLGEVYWKLKGRYRTDKQFAYLNFIKGAKSEGHAQASALAALGRYFEIVEKQQEQAQRCFKKALSVDPSIDVAGDGLCSLLVQHNRKQAALMLCKEITSRSPHAAWPFKRMGLLLVEDKRHKDAIAALQSALRINARDAVTWEALGSAYLALGRFTAALKAYGRSIELDSSREYSLIQSGNLSLALGNATAALEFFEKALRLRDKRGMRRSSHARHPSALLGAAEALMASAAAGIQLGTLQSAAMLLKQARKYAQECTACYATCISGWKMLGDICSMLRHVDVDEESSSNNNNNNNNKIESSSNESSVPIPHSRHGALNKARRAYSVALHMNPGMASLWHDVASVSYHQVQLYRAFSTSLNEKSTQCDMEQRREHAERALKGALRLDPGNSELWMAMGAVASQPAIREYSLCRSLQLNSRSAIAWTMLARLYIDAGVKDLSDACLQHARSQNAIAPWIWEAMSASSGLYLKSEPRDTPHREEQKKERAEYAEHAVGLGAGPEGLATFAEAAIRRGAIAGSNTNGTIMMHGKERKKASEDGLAYTAAHRAFQLAPFDASAVNTWALACEAKGDHLGAMEAYRKALEMLQKSIRDNEKKVESMHPSISWVARPLVEYSLGDIALENCIAVRAAVQLNLGRVLCREGLYREAVSVYRDVLTRKSIEEGFDNQWYAWMTYAVALAGVEDVTEAEHAGHAALDAARMAQDGEGAVAAVKVLMMFSFLFGKKEHPDAGFLRLQENIPRLEESKASVSGIKQLWNIAMAHAVAIGSSTSLLGDSSSSIGNSNNNNNNQGNAPSVAQRIYKAAEAWSTIAESHGADAGFLAQLHALLSLDSTQPLNGSRNHQYAEYCKALHLDPTSKEIRAAAVQSAIHVSPGYASLITSTGSIPDHSIAADGGAWKVAAGTQIAAVLSRCITACRAHCKHLMSKVTAAVHAEPMDTDMWYYAAVMAVQMASLNGTSADYARARSWCRIAAAKNKGNPMYMTYLHIFASECLLHIDHHQQQQQDNSNSQALNEAIAAAEISAPLLPAVHAVALRQIARCYWSTGEIDKASEFFNRSHQILLSHATKSAVAASLVVGMDMSCMQERQGHGMDAVTMLSQHILEAEKLFHHVSVATDEWPRDIIHHAVLHRAMILMRLEEFDQAKEIVKNQVSSNSSNTHSLSIMMLIALGAICLQQALQIKDVDDVTRHALLGEARRVLSEALQKCGSGGVLSDVTVLRILLAQVEFSGTMRKKEEKIAQHVEAVLESAQKPLSNDLLVILGQLVGSERLLRKANFLEPWAAIDGFTRNTL